MCSACELYDQELHGPSIVAWAASRGVAGVVPQALPPTGWVKPGVCAGFLYLTNSGVALLEGLVANPEVPAEQRDRELNHLVEHLLAQALKLGAVAVVGITSLQAVVDRAQRLGFATPPGNYQMVVKVLESKE